MKKFSSIPKDSTSKHTIDVRIDLIAQNSGDAKYTLDSKLSSIKEFDGYSINENFQCLEEELINALRSLCESYNGPEMDCTFCQNKEHKKDCPYIIGHNLLLRIDKK